MINVEKFEARVRREVDAGLLPSCQWAFGLDGEIVSSGALGDANEDTRYTIFSATKALVASTVWTCIAEGSIKVDARVADYIPEFASNGKDDITVEQVMLHTSGFPRNGWDMEMATSEGRRSRFANWKTNWEPGTRYEYHATTAHWVLAELIEVATGQNFLDVIEQRVTTPIGIPRVLGIPESDGDNIATLVNVGEPISPDEMEATFGVREFPATEVTPEALLSFNQPARRALGVPGGGGVTTARNYALFYQEMLHNQKGIWDEDVLRDATSKVRNSFGDPLFNTPANRALGVVIAGDDGQASLRGFGKTQSPRTFGHNGAGGQIAWADPESGLSFVYLTNGLDQHMIREAKRGVALSSLAAEVTKA
ncbi:MAG TPA: serine hydrolase domain-containing protein [Acidimicrobiales bacterium]|nr:serine hydrolase domain-containing protein [Acidimicrobiales bacterium]